MRAKWLETALLLAVAGIVGLVTVGSPSHAQGQYVVHIASAVTENSALTSYTAATASTNATSVKTTAGNVYHYSLGNTTATVYYLRMYNLAAAPTCSSATGFIETIMIPSSTAGAGRERDQPTGQGFTTGLAYCITGGPTSTDNTNAATGVTVTLLYR